MCSKQKSLNFGNYIPNDKVLNKKVPENPKYRHVKPAVDTGKNVRKHIDELKEKQKSCIHRKDEVFKRIKFSSFIKLALATAEDLNNNQNSSEMDMVSQSNEINASKTTHLPERRVIANVLMGVGELDIASNRKRMLSDHVKPMRLLPYVLLDVRDVDAFCQCHIKTAKHYPSAMLSRSIGYEIEDLKLYKNSPHSIIVLYDEDEVVATRVATTLVERGYENVFLLTGGLKLALDVCPHSLTTSSPITTTMYLLNNGVASQVQKSSEREHFSHDDIIIIRQYIDSYPYRDNSSLGSLSSRSRSKSFQSSHRNCLGYASSASHTSTTSCRESVFSSTASQHRPLPSSVSSKSSKTSNPTSDCVKISQLKTSKPSDCMKNPPLKHSKPNVMNDKVCKLKRAPWK